METEEMTLGQIFKAISKLKYKTIALVVSVLVSVVSASFAVGRYSYQKVSAVRLEVPFAMRIQIDNKNHDFTSLTLIKDPTAAPPSEDMVVLALREVRDEFDVIKIGEIVAKTEASELNNAFVKISYVKPTDFNWYTHKGDFKFSEKFVAKDTIERTYGDGCVLQYKEDANRRSIPASFKWIKVNH